MKKELTTLILQRLNADGIKDFSLAQVLEALNQWIHRARRDRWSICYWNNYGNAETFLRFLLNDDKSERMLFEQSEETIKTIYNLIK